MTTPLILCSLTIQVGFLSNYLGVFLWCKDLANDGGQVKVPVAQSAEEEAEVGFPAGKLL